MNSNSPSPYIKQLPKDLQQIDVYDVLTLFNVTNPALQHAIKKLLCPGQRTQAKDKIQDLREAILSIERAIEMEFMYEDSTNV